MTAEKFNPLKFIGAKAIAVATTDINRANHFYGQTLGLRPEVEDGEIVGFLIGDTIIMPKQNWYGSPTAEPNPRITLLVENAVSLEEELRNRGVTISDAIARYGNHVVGSFLDSEGNKLWFCSES
jgi:catechol 2,3-dioxygenase-like lactoylglutathione lyase family enzyme